MRSVLFIPFLALAAPLAAEEIAVEELRAPFCVIGEDVTVTVAEGMSMVEGQYELKYVPRLDPVSPSPTVTFEFPVLAPKVLEDLDDLTGVVQCKLRLGGAAFDPVECRPLAGAPGAAPPFVPEDTRVMLLVFRLPRALLRQRATLHLSYFQPHYHFAGKEITAILPQLPDFDEFKNELLYSRDDFTVTFEAVGAVRLHRLSANQSVVQDSPKAVKVHPANQEIIAVAVEPAVAPAGPAAGSAAH